MIKRYRVTNITAMLSAVLLVAVTSYLPMAAQPVPIDDPAVEAEVIDRVREIRSLTSQRHGIDANQIDDYARDSFAELLRSRLGAPLWSPLQPFEITGTFRPIEGKEIVAVTAVSIPDTLPRFGPLEVDWVYFLNTSEDPPRVFALRRTMAVEGRIELLRTIDTSSAFPESIKPDMVREHGAMLMSNRQLRQHFLESRGQFDTLISLVTANDSLLMIHRTGNKVAQLNNHMIQWGLAEQDVPQEAIEEYLAQAGEKERAMIEARLRNAEKNRVEAMTALQTIAANAGIPYPLVEQTGMQMLRTRISFINRNLPWEEAILLTVAGQLEEAVGYLYSPSGELPNVSPYEFFYLEELGDGWWLYRST